ncbi:unnamed protein product [Adineta ricciae]|uniref:Uncharacterized protein n=1 Tax=Adineta ricciae TaxID=249248 RepID=A0A815J150_ADIRI|nr:unnamed protein product [Adineta ricciae]CAF1378869.1 unnamed protein product [Adineta ricciae]
MTSATVYTFLLCCLLMNNQALAGRLHQKLFDDADDDLKYALRSLTTAKPSVNPNNVNFPSAYGKDSYDVYWAGEKIRGASASTFKILGSGYAKDSYDVYYMGQKLSGASASTFQDLGNGYAKDSWDVYCMGQKISGASASTFRVLGNGYAKDSWDVYYLGKKVSGASASTFSVV